MLIGIGFRSPFLSYRASVTSNQPCYLYRQIERFRKGIERTKESVRQGYGINPRHCGVVDKVRVNEEEHGHIHRLASIESLFFETETLYLAKVGSHLRRRNTVCGDTDYILIALVGCRVECQRRLPW